MQNRPKSGRRPGSEGNVTVSFRFRGKHQDGPDKVHLIEVPIDGTDDTIFMQIEPWRPSAAGQTWQPGGSKGLSYRDVATRAAADSDDNLRASPTAQANDLKTTTVEATRTSRLAAPAADGSVGEGGGRQRSRSPPPARAAKEYLEDLGLRVQAVSKDGACFCHSLAVHFTAAKLEVTTAGALRKVMVAHIKTNAKLFEPIWDRLDSHGTSWESWKKYGDHMLGLDKWAGELDALVLANLINSTYASSWSTSQTSCNDRPGQSLPLSAAPQRPL